MRTKNPSTTRNLLLCGACAGPLFISTVLVQDYTRPNFDPRLMPLSLLSLGNWGWVQILNFMLAGGLNLLYAVGLRRRLHPGPAGTWGPIFISIYGLGLVAVGVFTTDPARGYPPGAATPAHPSWHGILHALGALFVFPSLAAALVVLSRYFFRHRERGWGFYSLASTTLTLLFFFGSINKPDLMARFLRLATFIGWMAPSLIAIKLLSEE